jgi:hypothetical protein
MEVQKSCGKPCNISVFDERKALDLFVAYEAMIGDPDTPIQRHKPGKRTIMCLSRSHLVGDILFETGAWTAYPHQDWHYQELKGE